MIAILIIYIYIYIYIPLFCPGRVLMADIFLSYFGYSTIFGYKFWYFRDNSDIFITFRVHLSKSRNRL